MMPRNYIVQSPANSNVHTCISSDCSKYPNAQNFGDLKYNFANSYWNLNLRLLTC